MWVVFLYMAVLLLVIEGWSVPVFAMAAIATSGHGANPFILAATSPLIVAIARNRLRAAAIIAAVVLAGIVLNMAADFGLQGRLWPPKIGWAVVASKVLNDVPEAYDELCAERPHVPICRFDDEVRALTPHARFDAQYLWSSGLLRSGKMDWSDFDQSGRALFIVAITRHPWEFLRAALVDMAQQYRPHRGVGFSGYVDEAEYRIPELNLMDHDTLARRGLLRNRDFRIVVWGFNVAIYALAVLSAFVIAQTRNTHRDGNGAGAGGRGLVQRLPLREPVRGRCALSHPCVVPVRDHRVDRVEQAGRRHDRRRTRRDDRQLRGEPTRTGRNALAAGCRTD